MDNTQMEDARQQAWTRVKSAVRAYARNPTNNTAETVEACWKTIRNGDNAHDWQIRRPIGPGGQRDFGAHLNAITKHVWHLKAARARQVRTVGAGDRPWPVNEVVMRSLLHKGLTDSEIAALYHVPPQEVEDRRKGLKL